MLSCFEFFQIKQIKLKVIVSSTRTYHSGFQDNTVKYVLAKIKHVLESYLYKTGHEAKLTLYFFYLKWFLGTFAQMKILL